MDMLSANLPCGATKPWEPEAKSPPLCHKERLSGQRLHDGLRLVQLWRADPLPADRPPGGVRGEGGGVIVQGLQGFRRPFSE